MIVTKKELKKLLDWAYYCGLNNVAPRTFKEYLLKGEHINHLVMDRNKEDRIKEKRKLK